MTVPIEATPSIDHRPAELRILEVVKARLIRSFSTLIRVQKDKCRIERLSCFQTILRGFAISGTELLRHPIPVPRKGDQADSTAFTNPFKIARIDPEAAGHVQESCDSQLHSNTMTILPFVPSHSISRS